MNIETVPNPYYKGTKRFGLFMKRARQKHKEAVRRAKNKYRAVNRKLYMLTENKTEIIELLIQMDIALDKHNKYIRSEWEYLSDINYK